MDPIKFDAGDPNIFRYVGNDPVNWTDPSGLQYFQSGSYEKNDPQGWQKQIQEAYGEDNATAQKRKTDGSNIIKGYDKATKKWMLLITVPLKGAKNAEDYLDNLIKDLLKDIIKRKDDQSNPNSPNQSE